MISIRAPTDKVHDRLRLLGSPPLQLLIASGNFGVRLPCSGGTYCGGGSLPWLTGRHRHGLGVSAEIPYSVVPSAEAELILESLHRGHARRHHQSRPARRCHCHCLEYIGRSRWKSCRRCVSPGLSASGARSYDFGSDDVLCSYDDYAQTVNGKHSDSSAKVIEQDLHENRLGRPLANIYGQPEDFSREDVMFAVDKCMKKYADNLTRNLEGISGRLTQLELYCFKLERSIGEFRADMIREQNEEDAKLTSLEKHVNEVHRCVQIIRDKQEISETQKELSKLQLSQKDSTNSNQSQKSNEVLAAATTETKSLNDHSDAASNQQLALALPHQIPRTPEQNLPYKEPHMQQAAQPSLSMPPQDRYVLNTANTYYTPRQLQPHEHQNQALQPEQHYAQQRPQMHDISAQALPFPQYRAQWSQPMQTPQPSSQAQAAPRPTNPPVYAHYSPNQPANPIQPETYQSSSMAPPAPYTAVLLPSGYGISGSSISHHPSQHNMQRQPPPSLASQVPFKSGYIGTNTYPPSTMQGYNPAYVIDGSRTSHPQSFQPGSYATNSGNLAAAASQMSNNHPYGEMIEKAINMGYPRDQVIDAVQGIGESGQPLDLNSLLDRLNSLANGGTRRPWSG